MFLFNSRVEYYDLIRVNDIVVSFFWILLILGFTVRKLNCRGLEMSGTAYLDFDNCHVPVKNLIGKENEGFKLIMFNFNHERFYISVTGMKK